MDTSPHHMANLFAQLGLPSSAAAIEAFIAAHRPLHNGCRLENAPFWTAPQRTFLCEEILEDADWATVIDELNARLR